MVQVSPRSNVLSTSSYEDLRDKNKNGLLISSLFFLKATIGIGLIANQAFYFDSGYLLTPILAAFIIFIIGYNNILIVNVANSIEKQNYGVNIDSFEETALYAFKNPKVSKVFYISTILSYLYEFMLGLLSILVKL